MGRKHTMKQQDPILNTNYKYEKRKRQRLMERIKQKQKEELQKGKKLQLMQIQRKVDEEIEEKKRNLLNKTRKITKNILQTPKKILKRLPTNYQQIQLKYQNQQTIYSSHFSKTLTDIPVERQVKQNKTDQIGQSVRKELRGLFGVQQNQQPKNIILDQNQNPFIISRNHKKQTERQINGQLFLVSSLLINNLQHFLIPQNIKQKENHQKIIYSYVDFVYVENKEEATITNFRNNIIQHSVNHLNKCFSGNKEDGFTKCKILILTPFVGDARAIIELIDEKYSQYKIENRDKFDEMQDQFDHFRIGVSMNKNKQKIRYFTKFEFSDIIIASPLGLVTASTTQNKSVDYSYLSSVEIVYIDRASTLMMQNWTHVLEVIKNLNSMPKYQSLATSIDKIRQSLISLYGRIYRQTIVFTQYNFPQLNALKATSMHNWQGSLTNTPLYPPLTNSSNNLPQQHFYKISPKQPKDDLQCRMDFFKRKFWDQIHNSEEMNRIVIMVNSYFQFVKLKAFFERVNASAQCISEHTKKQKVQSRLAKFNSSQFRVLLLTERAYFFEVCQVKKFQHLYFYSLPKNNYIYSQLLEGLEVKEDSRNQFKIVSIYSKYDSMIVERILGTVKSKEMMKQYCNHVNFVV